MADITKKIITQITDLAPRLVQFFVDEGVVTPVERGSKRGQHHKYDERNVRQFILLRELSEQGMRIGKIKHVMFLLENGDHDVFDPKYHKGQNVYLMIRRKPQNGKVGIDIRFIPKDAPKKHPVVSTGELNEWPNAWVLNLSGLFF